MSSQSPLPFAFARRDDFLKLPLERRTGHLWHAHVFCLEQIGQKRFTDEELQRNLRVLRRMMLEVAKSVAKKLREDGSWKDSQDGRWPRNHKGDDLDHWYDSGAFPPQFLALPTDPKGWREVLAKEPEALFDEMIAWVETPAGQAGVGDVELQKLLADRDTFVPDTKKIASPEAPEKACEPEDRAAGLEWLAAKSADGSLMTWANSLKLEGIENFLGVVSSDRRQIDRLLPELMTLEKAGEWEALQRHLDVESLKDGAALAKLRSCIPVSRF